jgi:hypothetical protein
MAADVLGRGDDRETARRMWRQMYEQEEWGALKQNALVHLQILDALDLRDAVQARVDEYTRRFGRRPQRLQELVAAGLLAQLPEDPARVPLDYDPGHGRVGLSQRSPLWRPDQ